MAARFRGEFSQKVDGKGRMSIPHRFRRVLEENDPDYPASQAAQVVILYGEHLTEYMQAYTMAAISEIEERILDMDPGPEKRFLRRTYMAQSLTLEIDGDGRVVIPKAQRDKFGLSGNVTFMGMGDHFEIWPGDVHDVEEGDFARDFMEDKPKGFDPLELLPKKQRNAE